jgi:hypothetical protein
MGRRPVSVNRDTSASSGASALSPKAAAAIERQQLVTAASGLSIVTKCGTFGASDYTRVYAAYCCCRSSSVGSIRPAAHWPQPIDLLLVSSPTTTSPRSITPSPWCATTAPSTHALQLQLDEGSQGLDAAPRRQPHPDDPDQRGDDILTCYVHHSCRARQICAANQALATSP